MRKLKISKISLAAFALIALVAGCGREQTHALVPAVISAVPANAAVGVPVAQAITATFNQAMNATTINATTFTITGPGGAPVTGAVTYSGGTATFTPTVFLAPSTLYTATITTGAQGAAGFALAGNFVWTFTTGTIPTIVSTNPLNGATNVALNQKLSRPLVRP
jgi:Bacterial Ig-like domain